MRTYLISDGKFVKIGKSVNVLQRLYGLQGNNPPFLSVILVLDGDLEKELHTKFFKYQVRGEWYHLSDEIKSYVDSFESSDKVSKTYQEEERKILKEYVKQHPELSELEILEPEDYSKLDVLE